MENGTLDETLYCLRDAMDPVAIVDTSGAVQERFQYTAFGEVTYSWRLTIRLRNASDFDWEFLFHGEFRDQETGYYNYGYRYYVAEFGRWLSKDPIGEIAAKNLYGFIGNNLERFDVYGLGEFIDFLQNPLGLNEMIFGSGKGWEWIPFLSLGMHLLTDFKGTHINHYPNSKPYDWECSFDEDAAIQKCRKALEAKINEYLRELLGANAIGKDALQAVGGVTAGMLGKTLMKQGVRAATGIFISGGALTLEAIVDIVVVLTIAEKIKATGLKAIEMDCVCDC